MNVARTDTAAFTLEFESEQEVRNEHLANLAHGALRLPTTETVALYTRMMITLRGPWGGEAIVPATVVAMLPDGLALGIEGHPDETLAVLLSKPAAETPDMNPPEDPAAQTGDTADRKQTAWDRLRSLSQMEKILLAVKAERNDRALLVQDNDPRVLLSLLRNPRITVDDVVRLAKSSYLNYQIADVILKSPQWAGNLDVRLGLIHNPKTPQPFALRILPTLPDSEVKAIARGGTSMALKQAALRRLQGKP